MRSCFIFVLCALFVIDSVGQNSDCDVNINKLSKVKSKFYLEGEYPKRYNGEAYEVYPDNPVQKYLVWKIKDGVTVQLICFSCVGSVLYEENYDSTGNLSGKYLKKNEMGDTLRYGFYDHGMRVGNWINKERVNAKLEN